MDRKEFEKIMRNYQNWVYAISYNILKNHEDAKDIVQEVFLSLYEHYDDIENKNAIKSWLRSVTVNKSINKGKRNIFEHLEDFIFEKLSSSSKEKIEEEVYTKEVLKYLDDALDTLSPEHRAVLILREIENLSYEEIAKEMNCKIGTVMSRLFYARKKVQKFLERRIGKRDEK